MLSLTVGGQAVLLVGVSADVRVAVVEVAVPLAAVLAADLRVAGGDGGEGVSLPDGDGPQGLLPVPGERGVPLGGQTEGR